jgi:hypothetical protein
LEKHCTGLCRPEEVLVPRPSPYTHFCCEKPDTIAASPSPTYTITPATQSDRTRRYLRRQSDPDPKPYLVRFRCRLCKRIHRQRVGTFYFRLCRSLNLVDPRIQYTDVLI